MTTYHVCYRDVEDHTPRQAFELLSQPGPGDIVVKAQVIPALFGRKPIYIRWHHRHFAGDVLNLLTYTHSEPKASQIKALARKAHKFCTSRNT